MSTELFTNLKLYPTKKQDKVLAFGSVVIAGTVQVNFSVRKSAKGLWVSLPSHKGKDKEGGDKWFKDVWLPDESVRNQFEKVIIDAFEQKNGGQQPTGQQSAGEENQGGYQDGIPF